MPATSLSALDHLDKLAVLAGGLFAGTALYISITEVPAFQAFGLEEHWRFFPYMYERAAAPQAAFAVIAGLTGVVHGTRIIGSSLDRNLWLTAGSIFLGIVPYTIVCIAPTNKRIINDNKRVKSGKESEIGTAKKKELLDKWAALHLGRTVGSLVAFGAMVFGLSRHTSLALTW